MFKDKLFIIYPYLSLEKGKLFNQISSLCKEKVKYVTAMPPSQPRQPYLLPKGGNTMSEANFSIDKPQVSFAKLYQIIKPLNLNKVRVSFHSISKETFFELHQIKQTLVPTILSFYFVNGHLIMTYLYSYTFSPYVDSKLKKNSLRSLVYNWRHIAIKLIIHRNDLELFVSTRSQTYLTTIYYSFFIW